MEMTDLLAEITKIEAGLHFDPLVAALGLSTGGDAELLGPLVPRILNAVGSLISSGGDERKQAADLIAALTAAAGPDAIMAWVRSHVGSADERLRETAAASLAAVASSRGVAHVHSFVLSSDCALSWSWHARWTASRATELMAAALRPRKDDDGDTSEDIRLLADILYTVLGMERRSDILKIIALAARRLGEAAKPSDYKALCQLLSLRLSNSMTMHSGEVQAAFVTAVAAMIGLMDSADTAYYTRNVLCYCLEVLQSPDGGAEAAMLEVLSRCIPIQGWDKNNLGCFVISRFLWLFWVRMPARDCIRSYCRELADATAVLANRFGLPAIRKILAERVLIGQSEDCARVVMETMEKVLAMSSDDPRIEEVILEIPLMF